MFEIAGISSQMLFSQLLVGLINGAFYAVLSLGLAVIFGLLNIVNMAHGALYMLGAFVAWMLLHYLGIGYWGSLIAAPVLVGILGIIVERSLLRRIYDLDHLYGLLLTLGIAMLIEGAFRQMFGTGGQPYPIPQALAGGRSLGFMFLPNYRAWVVIACAVICLATWWLVEKTRLGAYLRAATENPVLVQAFGINVGRLITLTYGLGVGLAALAGVMAAPIYQISPLMGTNTIIVVFAVVVIGGMGSILGAIVSGFALGLIEGFTKVIYPEASTTVLFVIMALVLMVRPSGLFGNAASERPQPRHVSADAASLSSLSPRLQFALLAFGLVAPFVFYPVFLMKALTMALFACAFNLLVGYVGLLSFGHAAYFGIGAYAAAWAMKSGASPELGVLFGAACASLAGAIFGWLAIRRHGIYFSMVTLALAQLVYFLALQLPFTHGEDGLQGVPRGFAFGLFDLNNQLAIYYFIFLVFVVGFALVYRIIHSPFGQVLTAIRENEDRAVSLGYRTERYKLLAFVLSAAIAGMAGAAKCLIFNIAALPDVHWSTSGSVVLITLLGGFGTVLGPVVGAFALVGMESYLAEFGSWLTIIQGAMFVACVLLFRRGIVGEALPIIRQLKRAIRAHVPGMDFVSQRARLSGTTPGP